MIHRLSALLALGTVALLACGDGDGGASAPATAAGRVGVVLGTPADPQHGNLEAAMRSALEEHDQELVVQHAAGDPERQRQLTQSLAAQRASAIVVVPLDSTSLRPAIDAAAAARIPVFTVGLPVRGARVTTHVEADFAAAGAAAAEYMGAFLGPRLRAAVVGDVAAHGTPALEAGFRSTLAAAPTRVVSGTGDSDGTREGAAAATTALLTRDPGIDAIFAMDPASALGAMDAAYARRRADLVIVSFGATPPVLEAIGATGPVRAAVVQRLDEGARLLSEAIATQIDGDPVTPSIKVPVRLVTADSVRRQ